MPQQKLGQGLVDAVVDTYQTYTPQPIQDYVTAVGEATARQEQELQELLPEPVARLRGIDATQMTLAGISDFTNVAQPLIQAAFIGAEALVGKRVDRLTQPMQGIARASRETSALRAAGAPEQALPTPKFSHKPGLTMQPDTSAPGLNTAYPASKPLVKEGVFDDGAFNVSLYGKTGEIIVDDIRHLPRDFLRSKGVERLKGLSPLQQFRLLQEFSMKRVRQLPPGNYDFVGASPAHQKLYARLFQNTPGFTVQRGAGGKVLGFGYQPQNDPLSLYSRRQRHKQ